MKEMICTIVGIFGSGFVYFFGGVDAVLIALCIFMAVDYISGLVVAWVFKKSPKTETGKVSSGVSLKGLCKKVFMLVLVGVAHLLDTVLGVDFIRSGLVVALTTNETISIIENAGLMGIPIPRVLHNAIEMLNEKE